MEALRSSAFFLTSTLVATIERDANRPSHRRGEVLLLQLYSNEGAEPPHVHVEQAEAMAKFWLDPVSLASSSRFSGRDLRRLEKQVLEHRDQFLEAWHDYFGA